MTNSINIPNNVYDEMVKNFIKIDSSLVFGNMNAEHAKFIIRAFVESAKHSIEILSGSFCNKFYTGFDFYENIKAAAEKIKSSKKIRIITLSDNNSKTIFDKFEEINKSIGSDVISYIPCQYSGDIPVSHFMIVDNKRYREEVPHKDFGEDIPESVKASVCCNGPQKAQELLLKFNLLWRVLEERTSANA